MGESAIFLPYPPSVNRIYNTYVRKNKPVYSLHPKVLAYRYKVDSLVSEMRFRGILPEKKILGDISILMDFCPPDRSRRDLDNPVKALWDALQAAEVFENDVQIKYAAMKWHDGIFKCPGVDIYLSWGRHLRTF